MHVCYVLGKPFFFGRSVLQSQRNILKLNMPSTCLFLWSLLMRLLPFCSVLLLFENSNFAEREQSLDKMMKNGTKNHFVFKCSTHKKSTSFSMDSHNCWYFQSIMLFNMRKIVRFPLTLFLDHVVTFFMLLLVHTLAGRGRAMDNVKIRGLKKKTSHLQLISSLKQNCKMLLWVYQIILGWCPL